MNNFTECSAFPYCNAPLCPFDPSFNYACWYPDEHICSKREISPELRSIIKTQRKIKKKAILRTLLFTVYSLKSIKNVHRSIKGKDSDNTRNPRSK